ncbi:hypothetical protein FD754_016012 [Muntiacus muntjak]|uniref:Peptidase S1 domain-containing protein n=1 Tax=Muntiacus muntjak TaxID=9888 RepID=A0A5N3VS32_MUNMU|nr:hypothetical protein FD754_016012 [Muntiacus muntjak]
MAHTQLEIVVKSRKADHRGHREQATLPPLHGLPEIVTSQGKQEACGGFLIRDFVLTAAHCAGTRHQRFTLSFFSLTRVCNSHPRSHNRKQKEDTWQRLEVINIHLHPSRENVLGGWLGKNRCEEPASSTLQEVELRIVEPRDCSLFPAFDHNLQLCVGHPQSTKSAFKGDSGGPLLCAGVAQDIVSYGQSNARPHRSPGSPITGSGLTRS